MQCTASPKYSSSTHPMPSLAQISCDSVATETERDTERERITGLLNLLLHFSFLLRIKYVCIALEIRVDCDLYFTNYSAAPK